MENKNIVSPDQVRLALDAEKIRLFTYMVTQPACEVAGNTVFFAGKDGHGLSVEEWLDSHDILETSELIANAVNSLAARHLAEVNNLLRPFCDEASCRPIGRWVGSADPDSDWPVCGICGAEAPVSKDELDLRDKVRPDTPAYCPECGARLF